jgi:His/Glu/Gln/Arg/opine family amino acid ABC transporter permease subunit
MNVFQEIRFVFFDENRFLFVLKGLNITLAVSFFSLLIGVAVGILLAYFRTADNQTIWGKLHSKMAYMYIDVMRGTPTVLQLLIMYFLVFKSRYGITASMLCFGMNSGAYMGEIFRSGIESIEKGQFEAGYALGMDRKKVMRLIIFPQAIRNILPALGNEFISLIKETSILGYISIYDLTKVSSYITSRTYRMFLPLVGSALIYYLLIKTLTIIFERTEYLFKQR